MELRINLSDVQFQDMFDFLAQLRYHYFAELGAHEHLRQVGQPVGDAPTDFSHRMTNYSTRFSRATGSPRSQAHSRRDSS